MTDVRETGLNVFREMLPGVLPDGNDNVSFGGFAPELMEIGIENVFGRLWGRDGLSRRDRSLVTLGILIALRANDELAIHFRIARTNGLTDDEIAEVIYHSSRLRRLSGRRDRQQDAGETERLTAARGPRGAQTAGEMRRVAEQTRTLAERAEPPGGIEPPTYLITSESLYRLS